MGRLFWKLFLILWLAQISTVVGVGAFFWIKHRSDTAAAIEEHHPMDGTVLDLAASLLRYEGPAALRKQLAGMQPHGRNYLYVLDDQGHDLLGRSVPVLDHFGPRPRREVSLPDGRHYRLVLLPPGPPGMPGGPGRGGPEDPGPIPLIPVLAALLASLLFGAILARYLSKPIHLMSEAFQSVAKGQMDINLADKIGGRRDELADLGRDFDSLAQRLKQLIVGQRRLFHDVSHELRSPLARLNAAVDLARQQPDRLDEWLERIERESGRMDALVGEVLALARLDAESAQHPPERLAIDVLLEELVPDAEFEAQANDCSIVLLQTDMAEVMMQPELLSRALENVVRNAIHHTRKGSAVSLAVVRGAAEVSIEVCDCGPGVPEHELETIFEPFFRSEQNNQPGGYGLGLAMAHRIVQTHHGRIKAANLPQGGLRVSITLPLA
ncbi:copper sensory histidine kinase CpxA [Aquitalea magnusonii]|uniref:histidine kinase n=1 Tax=Aquitalea magnusonii TaxID=332411 RepID=A0A3G9GK61_9NEIS|nr:ATP-binding protein [Aquitalea magnusonii]BBF85887.1 copper sensory histidine kinase CpxA [Aquitalea magnusonii]